MPKYPKFKRYNIETAIYMPPVDSTNAVVCALLLPDSIPHAATIGTKRSASVLIRNAHTMLAAISHIWRHVGFLSQAAILSAVMTNIGIKKVVIDI